MEMEIQCEGDGNMNLTWSRIILLLIILSGCSTKSLYDKADQVDDDGRNTWLRFDISLSENQAFETNTCIKGQAHDAGGIQQIDLQLSEGAYQKVQGKENWQKCLTLELGENILRARLINSKGRVFYSEPIYIQCLWKKIGEMPQPLAYQNIVPHNGQFYFFGGWAFDWEFIPALDSFWKYDPAAKTFEEYSPSLFNAFYLASVVVYNNNFYAIGGLRRSKKKDYAKNAWVDIYSNNGSYDFINSKSIENSAFVKGGAAYAINGSSVYVFGGNDESAQPTKSILKYDLTNNSWSNMGGLELDFPLSFSSAVVYSNKIFIFGGKTDTGYSRSVFIYDIDTGSLSCLNDRLTYERSGMGVVKIENKVYLLGGENQEGILKRVEVFNLDNYTARELRPMPFALAHIGAVAYQGKILIFGGLDNEGFFSKDDVYEYYPTADDLNQ